MLIYLCCCRCCCSVAAGKLQGLMSTVAGRNVYLRFNCFAGDAMGMNMVSKGVLAVIDLLQEVMTCSWCFLS